jgi:hypothetical protein
MDRMDGTVAFVTGAVRSVTGGGCDPEDAGSCLK